MEKPYHRADARESAADLLLQPFREGFVTLYRGRISLRGSRRPVDFAPETLDKSAGF
jgi:hypothetical protein